MIFPECNRSFLFLILQIFRVPIHPIIRAYLPIMWCCNVSFSPSYLPSTIDFYLQCLIQLVLYTYASIIYFVEQRHLFGKDWQFERAVQFTVKDDKFLNKFRDVYRFKWFVNINIQHALTVLGVLRCKHRL